MSCPQISAMWFFESFFCPAVRCLALRSVLWFFESFFCPAVRCLAHRSVLWFFKSLYIYFFFPSSSEMFCPQVNVMTAQSLVVFCPFTRSPTSPMITFHREGFGRQSMSEKRKGHMDPRTSEVYQRAKASKDQKDNKGKLQLPASLSKYVFLTLFLK